MCGTGPAAFHECCMLNGGCSRLGTAPLQNRSLQQQNKLNHIEYVCNMYAHSNNTEASSILCTRLSPCRVSIYISAPEFQDSAKTLGK